MSGFDFDYRYDWVEQRKSRKYPNKKSTKLSKFEEKKQNLKSKAKELDKMMGKVNKILAKKKAKKL